MIYSPWTPEEEARLKELYDQRVDWPEISAELNRTAAACRNRLYGYVKTERRGRMETAEAKDYPRSWSDEDDNTLREMKARGHDETTIADCLNRTPRAVRFRWTTLTAGRSSKRYFTSHKRSEKKMRKCLGNLCGGKMFMSSSPGHRFCSRCRKQRGEAIDDTSHKVHL